MTETTYTPFETVMDELEAFLNTDHAKPAYFLEASNDGVWSRLTLLTRQWVGWRYQQGGLAAANIGITCNDTNNLDGGSPILLDVVYTPIQGNTFVYRFKIDGTSAKLERAK